MSKAKIENMPIRNVEDLCELAELLGYGQGGFSQLQCNNGAFVSSLLAFFDDNPGAMEAVREFMLENIDCYEVEDDEEDDEEEEEETDEDPDAV